LVTGAITVISPQGEVLRRHMTGDPMTTNIGFGGADQKTAYLTLSGPGQLVAMDWVDGDWSVPGLRLNHVI
jgi:gluconolactonase